MRQESGYWELFCKTGAPAFYLGYCAEHAEHEEERGE